MAYSNADFVKALALYSAGAAIGPIRTGKMLAYAAKKGITLGARGVAVATAPALTRTAGIAPVAAGAGLGFAFLDTPLGQQLLEGAAERGRSDRIALEQALTDYRMMQTPTAIVKAGGRKRKKSSFNAMVSAGMKALRASTSYGKKGTLTNAKAAFSTATKVASSILQGKKVAKSGPRAVAGRSMRKWATKRGGTLGKIARGR